MIGIERWSPSGRRWMLRSILTTLCICCAGAAQAACDNGRDALTDAEVVELATAEALKSDALSDLSVENMVAEVLSVDDVWEVTFQDPDWDPNMLGDNGFLVRMGMPCGHILEVLRYQ